MNSEPLEGFWTSPKAHPGSLHHFFIESSHESVCGKWRLREMGEDREPRKPGHADCNKCADIYRELFAALPTPQADVPPWTVKTDPVQGTHTLFYQGKEQSCVRGAGGLATQKELAAIFNKNGTLPEKSKVRCAADAPNAAKFLAKKSSQSPSLPLDFPISPTAKTMPQATTKTAESTTPQVELIPASHFRRYPTNRAISEDAVKNMETSVREVGIIDPLLVRAIPGETELEIIAGETRWLGCCKIDPEYLVPCFVRTLTDKESAKLHAISNFQRKDLNALEEGREIQNMKDQGWNFDEIMIHLGKGKDYLYQRINLACKLPPEGQQAFLEGNLSLKTVEKIVSLPEESRVAAIEAVCSPTRSAKALPEREAIQHIDREFVEPAKHAAEWEKRRSALLAIHPRAKWLGYDEAAKLGAWNSGYVRADQKPSGNLLSDAAELEELVVPTWGELAKKHGAEIVIGCNHAGEGFAYVLSAPLVDAEKAACAANPSDCIFVHEDAVHQAREDSERRKLEQQAQTAALRVEEAEIAAMVLAPEGLNKTAAKKLVEGCFYECGSACAELEDFAKLLGVEDPEKAEEAEPFTARAEAAVTKYLRSKSFTPFEAMVRLQLAYFLTEGLNNPAILFVSGACKPADFPVHHNLYQERLADAAKRETARLERAATAAAEAAKSEEDAA